MVVKIGPLDKGLRGHLHRTRLVSELASGVATEMPVTFGSKPPAWHLVGVISVTWGGHGALHRTLKGPPLITDVRALRGNVGSKAGIMGWVDRRRMWQMPLSSDTPTHAAWFHYSK
jgi:hypothetical protein